MFIKTKMTNLDKFFLSVILIGIIIRIILYSYGRPLWNDECALALNLVDFNCINCFKSLNYGQAAPPFFLLLSALFSKLILNTELSLRFFPLISSILSIFVFYDLSNKMLTKKITIFFALLLFCFNYQLVYYAQEFKQYSSDVLIFLSILTSYFYLSIKNASIKKIVFTGITYATCIWLSFTSLFAIFTVFCILILKDKTYQKIFILSIPIALSFICFLSTQHHLASSEYLHNYWAEGFINHSFNNFFSILINYFIFAFNNLFLFILFFVGIILKTLGIKDEKSLMLLIPSFLAIFLSYLSIYPLSSRVALYLTPVFIFFIVQILDYINFKHKIMNYSLCSCIIFIGSLSAVTISIYKIDKKNFEYENIIFPLNIAKQSAKNNDIVYISDGSIISYEFYKKNFHFKNVMMEEKRITDFNDYANFLDSLPKGKTYYYIFSHFPNKQNRLNNLYLWAKTKKDFKIYADKSSNALIIFTQ